MGVAAYLAQVRMSDAALTALPEAERALYESTPAWLTGAYALDDFKDAFRTITERRVLGKIVFTND